MKRDKNIWVDAAVIIGLLILVYFLCQPFSRDWGDGISEMFTGNEGVYARDTDTYYYLRKASEFTENGIGSIRIFVESDDTLRTYNYTDSNEKTPMLLSALAALLWYALQSIGIKVSIYWLALRFNSMVLALCTIPIYMFLKKRISRMASFYGAAVAVLSKPFFSGSWQGAFDTDTLICFFAVTGILCLYESVLSDARRKRILYSIVATVTMIGLYCTWTMYFVYVIIAIATAAFGIIVSALVIRRMPTWKECFAPVVAMLSWFAFAVVDSRLRLIKIFNSLFSSGKDIESWPNPASFVAEMQKPSFFAGDTVWDFFASREGAVIDYLGGGIKVIEIILSVVILVVLAIRCIKTGRVKTKKDESFLFSAIGSWFLGTLLMTFMGVRFFEFFILPCSLVLAFGMSAFFDSFQLQKPIERRVVAVCAAAIIFSVFVQ